jgi:molecular chaperone GrpE (heat shock protein)
MHTPESAESPEPIAAPSEPATFTPDPLPPQGDEAAAPEPSAVGEPLAADHDEPVDAPVPDQGPAPEEPDAETPAESAEVLAALSRIEAQLGESQRLIDRQAEISAKLHAENQVLRAGELRKAQTAIVLSVLRVLDDVNQMAATAAEEAARNDLSLVADALTDALARNGVDAVLVEPGVPFDGRRHKIATIEETNDPGADRTVARITRPGFAWSDGEIVRVSDVAVYKHIAPAEPEPAAEPEPDLATPTER